MVLLMRFITGTKPELANIVHRVSVFQKIDTPSISIGSPSFLAGSKAKSERYKSSYSFLYSTNIRYVMIVNVRCIFWKFESVKYKYEYLYRSTVRVLIPGVHVCVR